MQMNQRTFIQDGLKKPEIIKEKWDMKIYSSDELKKLLEKNGFKIMKFYGPAGSKFDKNKTMSIFVVAQKEVPGK
jgi:hypothetical protein